MIWQNNRIGNGTRTTTGNGSRRSHRYIPPSCNDPLRGFLERREVMTGNTLYATVLTGTAAGSLPAAIAQANADWASDPTGPGDTVVLDVADSATNVPVVFQLTGTLAVTGRVTLTTNGPGYAADVDGGGSTLFDVEPGAYMATAGSTPQNNLGLTVYGLLEFQDSGYNFNTYSVNPEVYVGSATTGAATATFDPEGTTFNGCSGPNGLGQFFY